MTVRSRARTIGVCAVCVLAFAAFASIAIGGKKLKTASETVEIEGFSGGNPVQFDDVTARCGKGKAVSGGFETEIDPDLMDTSAILPYVSRREGGKGWRSGGLNSSDVDGDLTSFAYCRKQKKVKTRSVTGEVEGSSSTNVEDETLKAKCKKGQTALSGGFDNPDIELESMGQSTAIITTESRKQGKRKWTVSGVNAGQEEGEYVASVVCHERKALKSRQAEDTIEATPSTAGVDDISVKCGKKRRVVSGGFSSDDPFEVNPSSLGLVFASHKQGNGWNISAVSTTEDHDFTVFAYCEKKKKKK